MFRTSAIVLSAALGLAALSACAPVTRTQGYIVLDANPSQAMVGTDTQQTVRTKYGSPTAISTFDPNVWYYMAQVTDQFGAYRPQVRQRTIVEITFDKTSGRVATVKGYDATQGMQVAYSNRETPTVGRELGIWEQLIGTLGRQVLPQEDDDPGNPNGPNRR